MPTVAITPHPTRKSTRVPKSPQRLGDSPPYLPQKKSIPTHELICTTSTPPCSKKSSLLADNMAAETTDMPEIEVLKS